MVQQWVSRFDISDKSSLKHHISSKICNKYVAEMYIKLLNLSLHSASHKSFKQIVKVKLKTFKIAQ